MLLIDSALLFIQIKKKKQQIKFQKLNKKFSFQM
jgi:hypothetical protein